MRSFNFRLLGFMMLGAALLSVGAYGIHEFQVKRHADVLLREANFAKERKDIAQAIDYLERYVVLVPRNNAGPLADLGLLLADAHQVGAAYATLEKALRQDSSRNDVRRRLIEVAIALDRYPDARHHVEVLLKASPEDSGLFALLAKCQAAVAEYKPAVVSLEKAIGMDPIRLEYYLQLAVILHGPMKNAAQALDVLDDMVKKNADSAKAYVIHGTYRLDYRDVGRATDRGEKHDESPAGRTRPHPDPLPKGEGDNPPDPLPRGEGDSSGAVAEALEDARRALELAPDDEAVIVFGVRSFLAGGRHEEAGELARRGLKLHPKNAPMYGSLAEVELKAGRRDEAIAALKRGLTAIPDGQDLLWNLSQLLIDEGAVSDAAETLERLRKTSYPRPPIIYLESRLLINEGKWFEASRRLEGIRPALAEWPDLSKQADLWLGECYAQLGRKDLQLTAFRRAAGVDSRWLPARLGVAGALLSTGRIDEALDEYREIASLPGAPPAVLVQLTRLLVLVNLRKNASEQNWDAPLKLLDQLAKVAPDETAVPILRAEILVAQKDDQKAEELLVAARDESPKVLDYWLGLAALAERRDDETRAAELLQEASAAIGDSVPVRLAQARHLAVRQREDARDSIRELARPAKTFDEEERLALYSGLAGLTLAIGDFEETERLCNAIAEAQPTNLRVRIVQFDLAFRAKNTSMMEQVLDQVREIEGSGPFWHYGEAVRLAIVADLEKQPQLYTKAKDHLTEARIARPGWSRIPLLLAHINDAQGDEEAAIANYTQAVTLGERDPNVVSRAVALLYQRRRFTEADRLIRHLQEQQSPFSNEMTRLATEVSMRLNDSERALSLVTKAASASKDPAEHIWAGRVFSALGKNDDAEQNFRKAIELDETSAEAWVGLILHLGRTLQVQKTDEALKEAETRIKLEEGPLALAQALEAIGRLDEAETRYQVALDLAPEAKPVIRRVADFYLRNSKIEEAEPLFQRVMEGEGATDDDRLWGRRNMALALLARRTPESLQKALSLVNENLAHSPDSEADLRTKALVLALTPDRESMLEAADLLEKALGTQQLQAAEGLAAETRFVLADLYLKLEDVPKATGQLRKLMAAKGDEPRYLAYYVRFLLSRKEYSEAELWLDRLIKVAPQQLDTLALNTEILFHRDQYAELLAAVDAFLSNVKGNEAERQLAARSAAGLLETHAARLKELRLAAGGSSGPSEWERRFVDRADALYRSDVEARPQDAPALAAFFGRQGRHTESLEILEKEWETSRPEDIAAITATLIKSPAATKEHFARARQILESALDKNDRPVPLLMALANLQNWGENYGQAEQLYREVLQKEGRNAGALNNLAVLMALRGRGGKEPLTLIAMALEVAGGNPALLDSRATIYLALGEPARAADDLAQATRRRPAAASYFRQAQVELRLGKREPAQKSLAKAVALGLRIEDLHPLERPGYRQLQAELR